MRICLITCLLVLSLVLCGCTDGGNVNNGEVLTELNGAIESVNAEERVSGEYMIEITVSGVTLYYAKGDIAFDRQTNVAFNDFTQTYMSVSSVAKNFYSNGKLISVEKGNVTEFDRTSEQILGKFPYCKLLKLPENISGVTEKSSSVGRTVELVRKDTSVICESVVGKDIHNLASVIKKPQPDKTQYSDTKCVYTVKDGRVVGCRYEFTVKLFDTPAYVPGYSVPESEYTVDLDIVAKVNYDGFGDGVAITEYSEIENTDN